MILDDDQLFALTKKKRGGAQAAALNALGIAFRQRADGSVVVSEVHVLQVLGVVPDKKASKIVEPKWDLANA